MPYDPKAVKLVDARIKGQLRKAGEKYGEDGLSPCGDRTKDVFDYAVNELAGMPRYCEIMANRLNLALSFSHPRRAQVARVIARVREDCLHHAIQLETARAQLGAMGLLYGEEEKC